MSKKLITLAVKQLCHYLEECVNKDYLIFTPPINNGSVYLGKKIPESTWWAIKVIANKKQLDVIKKEQKLLFRFAEMGGEALLISKIIKSKTLDPKSEELKSVKPKTPGNSYCISELMDGRTLKDQLKEYLKEDQYIPESEVKKIAQFLIGSLILLADHQIVHNRITPASVFVKTGGGKLRYKLGDFSCARDLNEESERGASSSEPVEIKSDIYLAPEVKEERDCSYMSDIWSLGVTLYELATGKLPNINPLSFPEEPKLSEEFKDFIELCLQKDPNKRIRVYNMLKQKLFRKEIAMRPLRNYKTNICDFVEDVMQIAGFKDYKIELKSSINPPYIINKPLKKPDISKPLNDITDFSHIYSVEKKQINPSGKSFKCILKTVKLAKIKTQYTAQLLVQELATLMHLNLIHSPYCLPLDDSFVWPMGESHLHFCIVLKTPEGETLSDALEKKSNTTKMHISDLQLILWNVAKGLKDMHSKGIIHRDLNPKSIFLVTENERIIDAKLSSFRKTYINSELPDEPLKDLDEYSAPEMKNPSEEVLTTKIDIWSFGILMCKLLYNKTPLEIGVKNIKELSSESEEFKEKGYNQYYYLMMRCLVEDPYQRLCIDKVLSHTFFEDVYFKTRTKSLLRKVGKKPIAPSKDLFECSHEKLGNKLLARIIPYKEILSKEAEKAEVYNEIKILNRIRTCKNVVKLFDYYKFEDKIHLILSNTSFSTLKNYVNDKNNKGEHNVKLISGIATALKDIHSRGVYHNALNPNNVLVHHDKKSMKVCIKGFKVKKSKSEVQESDEYMAPELKDAESSSASDVWSFGMLIYFIQFKESLYKLNYPDDLQEGDIKIPTSDHNPRLTNIMKRCLNVNPSLRSSIHNLHDELISLK